MNKNITVNEDGTVVVEKCAHNSVQGETNIVYLNFTLPSTICGIDIGEYQKFIEFKECKQFGECKKFYDIIDGTTYALLDTITNYGNVKTQLRFEYETEAGEIKRWKSEIFELSFDEAINAEETAAAQNELLSLTEILNEYEGDIKTTKEDWEAYIKDNTFRVVSNYASVPVADADTLGETIFYLGSNIPDPNNPEIYLFEFGCYYRCIAAEEGGVVTYSWNCITKDPNFSAVAYGIKEVNNQKTMQLWVGTEEERENEVAQPNTIYLTEDTDLKPLFYEVLTEMLNDSNGLLKCGDYTLFCKKPIFSGTLSAHTSAESRYLEINTSSNITFEVGKKYQLEGYTTTYGFHTYNFCTPTGLTSVDQASLPCPSMFAPITLRYVNNGETFETCLNCVVYIGTNKIYVYAPRNHTFASGETFVITNIYEIIE